MRVNLKAGTGAQAKTPAFPICATEMRRLLISSNAGRGSGIPIWILVQPAAAMSVRACGVTASGRVSITSPTTRCFAVSLMRCWRSSSSIVAVCHSATCPTACRGCTDDAPRAVIAAHGSIHTLLLVGNAARKLNSLSVAIPERDSVRVAPPPPAAAHWQEHRRAGARPQWLIPGRANTGWPPRWPRHRHWRAEESDINHISDTLLVDSRPGTAKHNELDLIGRMTHLRKRGQTGAHLQIWIEAVLLHGQYAGSACR